MKTRTDCETLDKQDRLGWTRKRFVLPDNIVYLDGNSLGPLPVTALERITGAVTEDWGAGLITSWIDADWFTLPTRAGDTLAPLVGAGPGEIVFGDSTSVCLFKLASALLPHSGERKKIVTEAENFPTDIYILEGLIRLLGRNHTLVLADADQIEELIDDDTALVVLTQVNYRSGAMLNMKRVTELAKKHGAPIIWDLCHSAGAVPLDLNGDGVDYAIGCSYKYLNGGPGAPAFTYISKSKIDSFEPLLTGWHGHVRQFEFESSFEAAASIHKAMIGTPAILSLIGTMAGLATFEDVDMSDLREKSLALTNLFISLVQDRLSDYGFEIASPLEDTRRGSQVSLRHTNGYPIVQYLISRGFIGDFREPGILRFGFAPLYIRFVDVWDCVECLVETMKSGAWDKPEFTTRKAVT